jgi:tRNA (guanine37-N1)-methyltransferase
VAAGASLQIDVITLFPELFRPVLAGGVLGRAIEKGVVVVELHDLREHGLGRHRTVDDTPYGGGAGMVLRPEPLAAAIGPFRAAGVPVILLDPAGERRWSAADTKASTSGSGHRWTARSASATTS